jgi:hypothetical protein
MATGSCSLRVKPRRRPAWKLTPLLTHWKRVRQSSGGRCAVGNEIAAVSEKIFHSATLAELVSRIKFAPIGSGLVSVDPHVTFRPS